MRIVHILLSLRGGGIQNFTLSLATEQKKLGHQVSVIVIDKYDSAYCQNLENKFKDRHVDVYRLNKLRSNKLSLLKTICRCSSLLRSLKPDIVNTHSTMSHLYGSLATLVLNTRHVVTVHNTPEPWNWMVRCLNRNKPIIFCSQSAYNMRRQNSRLMVPIDNGISREIVASENVVDLRLDFGLSKDDKVIVLAGSLRPQKNYHFLKEISAALNGRPYHFFVCGGKTTSGGIDTADFVSYPNIHFLGLRSDVSAIENGADLFLSCALFEGLPIAVLEAYFNGIPCVLSPISQHRIISEVKYVWIPDEFTAEAFVEKIEQALECPYTHGEIYEMRKSQIERFSIRQTAIEYVNFYENLKIRN